MKQFRVTPDDCIWLCKRNIMKMRTIVYNWKTDDLMETGFSSNIRPKRAENTPGCHHASNNTVSQISDFNLG